MLEIMDDETEIHQSACTAKVDWLGSC